MSGALPKISLSFSEGRFFDLWMFVHGLSGAGLAFLFIWLRLERLLSYIYAFIILFAWEFIEIIFGIVETASNRVLDVVLAFLVFTFVYEYFHIRKRIPSFNQFVIISITLIISAVWGWVAYIVRESLKS